MRLAQILLKQGPLIHVMLCFVSSSFGVMRQRWLPWVTNTPVRYIKRIPSTTEYTVIGVTAVVGSLAVSPRFH